MGTVCRWRPYEIGRILDALKKADEQIAAKQMEANLKGIGIKDLTQQLEELD